MSLGSQGEPGGVLSYAQCLRASDQTDQRRRPVIEPDRGRLTPGGLLVTKPSEPEQACESW